jgi:O-antigen ligase
MIMFLSVLVLCAWIVFLAWDYKKAVIVLPAFFPLYLMKFQVGFVPFTVIEMMVYFAVLWVFVKFLRERFYQDEVDLFSRIKRVFWDEGEIWNEIKKSFFKLLLPSFGLLLGSLSGLYVAHLYGDTISALGIFKGWVLMPMLYAALVIRVLRSVEDKKATLYFYMLSALVLGIWGVWQVITGDFITIDGRASGPFESANYLALYIGPSVVLSGILLWQRAEHYFFGDIDEGWVKTAWLKVKNWIVRAEEEERSFLSEVAVYELIVFFTTLIALLYSMSYGGIIAVFGGFFLYAVYELFFSSFRSRYGELWKKIIVFVVMIVIGILAGFSQIGTTKFDDFLAFERQSSSSVRIQTWTVTKKLIEEEPFLGIGLGRFQSVYEQRAEGILGVAPYEETMLHPHNLWFSTWLNAGMIGAIAIPWIFIAVFWTLRNKELDFEKKRLFAVILAMFAVVGLHGLVDQTFWKNDLALLWWMIIGLVI